MSGRGVERVTVRVPGAGGRGCRVGLPVLLSSKHLHGRLGIIERDLPVNALYTRQHRRRPALLPLLSLLSAAVLFPTGMLPALGAVWCTAALALTVGPASLTITLGASARVSRVQRLAATRRAAPPAHLCPLATTSSAPPSAPPTCTISALADRLASCAKASRRLACLGLLLPLPLQELCVGACRNAHGVGGRAGDGGRLHNLLLPKLFELAGPVASECGAPHAPGHTAKQSTGEGGREGGREAGRKPGRQAGQRAQRAPQGHGQGILTEYACAIFFLSCPAHGGKLSSSST